MLPFRPLPLDELLDLCVLNRLIHSYHHRGPHVVLVQEEYVHELSPEHAHLFLENLVRYARDGVHVRPPLHAVGTGRLRES